MAIIKTTAGAAHLSGKHGGVIFAQHRCSYQINSLPRGRPRRGSANQEKWRKAFGLCMWAAGGFYTYEWMILWSIFGNGIIRYNRKGDPYSLTWLQAFISVNQLRIYNGLPALEFPPHYENSS